MKQILFILIAFLPFLGIAIAQPITHHNNQHFDIVKFNKEKADYIISKVKLTPFEANQFIPLMNELQLKRFKLNREVRNETRKIIKKPDATDADYQRLIELSLNSNIKEAELNKEYYKKFRLVLSPKKIYECQSAESDFMNNFMNLQRQKRKEKNK